MPLFDFRCTVCDHLFEALVRPANPEPLACPKCGAAALEKQLSSFAVSSPERTQAAATVKREKAAAAGRRDNVAIEREVDAHRREDH